ncbi:MAG: NAD(+) synthase [Candidatus Omnitrophota bacterium]
MSVLALYEKDKIAGIYLELVDGIKRYADGHGFTQVIMGLSGGIDSGVTCCLAVKALGSENVLGLSLPSKYSSKESGEYAEKLAKNLGIKIKTVPISGIYDSYLDVLEKDLGGNEGERVEIYHQNIQARIRGNVLMAFSNRFGYLVLATGNKSEAQMGYCTLYGDTVGGLAVLANVYKAGVYKLAGYINRDQEIIPQEIIDRVPSAELKPGQADHHSLPSYDILDEILYCYLDEKCASEEIINKGFDPDTVKKIIKTVEVTEYKRKQCPPGLKLNK